MTSIKNLLAVKRNILREHYHVEGSMSSNDEFDQVVTPGGIRPRTSTHPVQPGQTVTGRGIITDLEAPAEMPLPQADASAELAGMKPVAGNPSASSVAKQNPVLAPVSTNSNLVLTPGGYRDKSLVHAIEPNYILDSSNGRLRKIDKSGLQVSDFGQLVRRPNSGPLMPGQVARHPSQIPALGAGWIAFAFWSNTTGNPVSSFATTWTVPPAPANDDGQVIFLFNGIQNGSWIYQPVLQWGRSAAGGGSYWAVACWYADGQGGQAFFSHLVPVNPGDTLVGIMTLTEQSGSQFSYSCQFAGMPTTSLPITNIDELTWNAITLEAYGLQQASDYPNYLFTAFTGIDLETSAGHPTITWIPVNAVTDVGQSAKVLSNANPGGEVDLFYKFWPAPRSYAFVIGDDGQLWLNWWNYTAWAWSNQGKPSATVSVTAEAGAITVMDSPTSPQRPYAFVIGSDGHLWVQWWNGSAWYWSDQGKPPGTQIGASAGVITVMDSPSSAQRPYVFVVGGDGELWLNWWNGSAWSWSNQGKPSTTVSVAAEVGAITVMDSPTSPQRPYAFVIGSDGHLWVQWWNGSAWYWSDQGKPSQNVTVAAGVGVVGVLGSPSSGQYPYVFVKGSDRQLWLNYWDGSAWHWKQQGPPSPGVTLAAGEGAITVQT